MNRYKVYFIDDMHQCLKAVSIFAATPIDAMQKAEWFYRDHNWTFEYTDIIAEIREWKK